MCASLGPSPLPGARQIFNSIAHPAAPKVDNGDGVITQFSDEQAAAVEVEREVVDAALHGAERDMRLHHQRVSPGRNGSPGQSGRQRQGLLLLLPASGDLIGTVLLLRHHDLNALQIHAHLWRAPCHAHLFKGCEGPSRP
jgi:hypothetical protein